MCNYLTKCIEINKFFKTNNNPHPFNPTLREIPGHGNNKTRAKEATAPHANTRGESKVSTGIKRKDPVREKGANKNNGGEVKA